MFTKDNGLETKDGGMVYVFGQMVVNMKEPGKMTSKTAMEFFHKQMVIFTKAKSKTASRMEKVS